MEAKKKEHLKLEKNSGLYFVIGLTLILALIYTALEWKTFDKETIYTAQWDNPNELEPEIPPVVLTPPPPPPPKIQVPTEFDIKDDDEDIVEDVLESNEVDQYTEIPIQEANFEKPADIIDEVPFMVIEDVPIFPGCENASDKRECFQEKILKHVKKNFKYPETAIEMGLQGRVDIVFTIEKNGSIGNVRMRGPHQVLENEASRIIGKLPKMEPGKQRGQAVKVPFSIPITFRLQ